MLQFRYFGHLMWRANSLENPLMLGKILSAWGQKEKRASEDEMAGWHHQCNGHETGQTLGDSEGQGGLAVHRVAKSQTRLGDWTTEIYKHSNICASFFTFRSCTSRNLIYRYTHIYMHRYSTRSFILTLFVIGKKLKTEMQISRRLKNEAELSCA